LPYTGAVDVGGPADLRELPELKIAKLAVGPMNNNAYLLTCRRSGESLLVDAANEPARLLELVGGTHLGLVFTTHGHFDHWQALDEVVRTTGAAVAAHPADAADLPVVVSHAVAHGEAVRVGGCEFEVVHLRGHTPGSVALLYRDAEHPHLFTGDSLFPGGPGRTTTPADFGSLMDDLQREIFDRLPDDTWVYPGHGADTTLGAERPHLDEWRARGW
jgi:glyoxylase-like metal-dependent hydrolase (beta-lactamase superfamily II)